MGSRWKTLTLVLAAAVIMAVVSTGCKTSGSETSSTTPPRPVPAPGGTFVFGLAADPSGFDPATNPLTPSGWMIARAVFDPLAVLDQQGRPVPYLAESFTSNPEFTKWTIRTRPDVTFTDGAPFDASALKTNLEDRRKGLLSSQAMALVTSVDVIDGRTVEVSMSQPWAHFPYLLTNQTGFMVSPNALRDGDQRTVAAAPVGTGPFKLVRWNHGESIETVRNDRYWQTDPFGNRMPYLASVTFKVLTDPSTRMASLTSGDVDAFQSPDPAIAAAFLTGTAPDVPHDVNVDGGDEQFVALNTQTGPFTNKALRQAAAEAIDPNVLNQQLFGGTMKPARGPFTPESGWGESATYPKYDPSHAKELVAANSTGPVPVTLTVINSGENLALAQAVASQLDAVGFTVSVNAVTETRFAVSVVTGESDMTTFAFWYDSDPDGMWHYLTSRSVSPPGGIGLNFARFGSPEIDQAIDAGRASTDLVSRRQSYQQVWDILGSEVPYLWLFHVPQTVAWSPRVHGLDTLYLPDGGQAKPIVWGSFTLAQTWMTEDASSGGR